MQTSARQISTSSRSSSCIQELHHYLSVDGTCKRGMHGIVEMYMHAYLKDSCCTLIYLPSTKRKRHKRADPHPRGSSTCTSASCNAITVWIKGLHHRTTHHHADVPNAMINNPAILDQLQCLCQPPSFHAGHLYVCTTCTVKCMVHRVQVYIGEAPMLLHTVEASRT